MTDGTTSEGLVVRFVAASRRANRLRNEDAIAVDGWHLHGDSDLVLDITVRPSGSAGLRWAVADGMGGGPAGHVAARQAVAALTTAPRGGQGGPSASSDPGGQLRSLFEAADAAVRDAATDETVGLGCTVAYVDMAASGETVVANLGDVRVYQLLDGYLGMLTLDDRPPPEERSAPGRVLRHLGGRRFVDVTPHHYAMRLHRCDVLIAMTDGIHDYVSSEALEAALDGDLATSVQNILTAAVDRRGTDNMTVVAVEVLGTA